MKSSEYQRSRSFFDLGQRSLRFHTLMFDFGLYTQVSDSGPHGPLVSGLPQERSDAGSSNLMCRIFVINNLVLTIKILNIGTYMSEQTV